MNLAPISFRDTNAFILAHHRHHKPAQGHKFSIAAAEGETIVGVVMVGRPVSRMLDNGFTAEVTRLCTTGEPNACSMLYAAAWRASKAMGYRKIITYILAEESGVSLHAAGWVKEIESGGGSWSRSDRGRIDKHPLGAKTRWACSQ